MEKRILEYLPHKLQAPKCSCIVCKVTVCLRIYNIPVGFTHILVVISGQSLSKPTAGDGGVVTGHCLSAFACSQSGQKAPRYHL